MQEKRLTRINWNSVEICLTFVVLIGLSSLLSCEERKKYTFSEKFIEAISDEPSNLPSQFPNVFLFCKCQNSEVIKLNVYELKAKYLREYKEGTNYKSFLRSVLNQELLVICDDSDNTFKVDSAVYQSYQESGLIKLIKLYCNKNGDDIFWLNDNLSIDQKNTVLYLLFINNFIASEGDHFPGIMIKKIE